MSRSTAASRRGGGELVDCGSWDSTVAASASAASSTAPRSRPRTALAPPPPPPPPPAASTLWIDSPPTTIGVDVGSDRPLYCLSVNETNNSFVVGGADHSLRVYDLTSGSLRRELYSKTSGHTEWVTTCACVRDGRVVSGGMDGKLVLWASSGARGVDLVGHGASISKLLVDTRDIAISGSYDKSIKVWSIGARPRDMSTIRVPGAITALDWHGSLVAGGTREGHVGLFDINTGQSVRAMQSGGSGQVLSLQLGSVDAGTSASASLASGVDPTSQEWLLASCGGDGFLRLFDLRTEQAICARRLSSGRPGSVNDVAFGRGFLVAALSDGICTVLDARAGFATREVLRGHRAPVACARIPRGAPGVVCSAASNGWLLVHDLDAPLQNESDNNTSRDAAYALGLTTQGGINDMWVGEDTLVAAGDDGNPVVLKY